MRFSATFRKALDAIAPRDPHQEAIDWAKANPYFRIGEVVAAYEDNDQGIFTGYGTVVSLQWNDHYETWVFGVRMTFGPVFRYPSFRLRDTSPHEQRMLWTAIRGGRA